MNAVSFRWFCLNCQQANAAGSELCAACDFPGSGMLADRKARAAGKTQPKKAVVGGRPSAPEAASRLGRLACALLIGSVLFVPLSIYLAWQFATLGSGGPGGWGSGFFILLTGIGAVSPTLFFAGLLALFAESFRTAGKSLAPWLAWMFTCVGLVLLLCLGFELFLFIMLLRE